ncbi:hypothetical protein BDN72DRAFT_844562 [Pluteus cervinus]|uniref:Uncharacterized protein n=1 Tax=Pluteus cervinus TaxID=181527 RepID=A0ACD3AKS4_9AGAR|nr:hypothetical protein BDN72DRAFT_844562 [Pluteus cervinus]
MPRTLSDPESVDSSLYSSPDPRRVVVERRRARIGCILLLPALLFIFLSAGLGAFLLLWLIVIHDTPGPVLKSAWEQGAFIVNEGTKVSEDGTETANPLGLTISTVTTNIVSISAPFLVGLAGYCVAGMWLRGQEKDVDDDSDLPTPLQYGLLVKLSSAPGLNSIYAGIRYLYLKKPRSVAAPRFISMAFALGVIIYLVTHLISIADISIHYTTSAVVQNTTKAFIPDTDKSLYGVAYNDTSTNFLLEPSIQKLGLLIAANASSSTPAHLSVISLHDEEDLAVVVPFGVDPQLLWTGPSFGMRATCSNITPQCLGNSSGTYINYNCSDAGYPSFPTISNPNQGDTPINTLVPGSVMYFDNNGTNPNTVIMEFNWPILIPNIDCPNTFATFCQRGVGTGFASCEVEVFNLTIHHHGNGTYALADPPEPSNSEITQLLMLPLIYRTTFPQLHMNLLPHIVSETDDTNIMAAVNQELTRTTLAAFAGVLVNVPAQNFFKFESSLVSRYSVVPVLAYVSLLLIYSLLVVGIFVWASSIRTRRVVSADGKTMSPMLALAQAHLTDPMVIIPSILNSQIQSGSRLAEMVDPMELFVEDENTTRLVVGVNDGSESELARSGPAFCVRERK